MAITVGGNLVVLDQDVPLDLAINGDSFAGVDIQSYNDLSASVAQVLAAFNQLDVDDLLQVDENIAAISNLQSNITSLQNLLQGVDLADIVSNETAISTLEANVTALQSSLSTVQTNLSSTQSDLTTLTGRVTDTESDITGVVSVQGTQSTDISTLESDLSALETSLTSLSGSVSTVQTEVSNLDGRVTTAESDISTLQSDVSALQAGGLSANDILDELKTVDGPGSGLAADVLDGFHAYQITPFQTTSDYADGTLVNTDITGLRSFVIHITGKGYSGVGSPIHWIVEGYRYSTNFTNFRVLDLSGNCPEFHAFEDDSTGILKFWWPRLGYWTSFQIYVYEASVQADVPYNRVTTVVNSTLPTDPITNSASIIKSWNSDNDGPGSGLNADVLDGYQASSFLRSDLDDSFSGKLTSTKTAGTILSHGVYADALGINATHGTYIGGGGGGSSRTLYASGVLYDGAGYADLWHSRNDGSGSGLDADLLDGLQGSAFFRIHAAIGGGDDLDSITDGVRGWGGTAPTNAPFAYGSVIQVSLSGQPTQLAFGHTDGRLAIRRRNSGTWQSWVVRNPEGAGNGLDADKLDGIHASSFLRSNANDVVGGGIEAEYINLGNTSGQNWTTSPSHRSSNFLYCVNNGNFTITNDGTISGGAYSMVIRVDNVSGAGTCTFSGFDLVDSDEFDTTNGSDFFIYITRLGNKATAIVRKTD